MGKPYERKDDDVDMKDGEAPVTAIPVAAPVGIANPHARHKEGLRALHATIKQLRDKRDQMPKKSPEDREARVAITKQCEKMLLDYQELVKTEVKAWEEQRAPDEAADDKEKWLVNHRRRQKAWKTRKRHDLGLKN